MVKDSSRASPGSRWMRWKPARFFFVGGDAAQYVADIELHYFSPARLPVLVTFRWTVADSFGVMTRGSDVEVGVLEGGVA